MMQGERDTVKSNRSLGQFKLTDIQAMKQVRALSKSLTGDANGQLTVWAKDLTTGKASQIQVKPSYGLSEWAGKTCSKQALIYLLQIDCSVT